MSLCKMRTRSALTILTTIWQPHPPAMPDLRIVLNRRYRATVLAQRIAAKFYVSWNQHPQTQSSGKTGPIVLSLELRHGDMVVMHGEEIQRIYEVCIPLPLPTTWLILSI